MGHPLAILERDSNFVNQIKNLFTGSQIKSGKTESNQVKNGESNQIINSDSNRVENNNQHKASTFNDGSCVG